MEYCFTNPNIVRTILFFIPGPQLAKIELVNKMFRSIIKGSASIWRLKCLIEINAMLLHDMINWTSLDKDQFEAKGPLAKLKANYWKRIYSDWYRSKDVLKGKIIKETISLPSIPKLSIVTCVCLTGDWLLIGTNEGQVKLYSHKTGRLLLNIHEYEDKVVDVLMMNEQHINKYTLRRNHIEWANTFLSMNIGLMMVSTFDQERDVFFDKNDEPKKLYFWRQVLVVTANDNDFLVYKMFPRSVWDGERETRLLEVKLLYRKTLDGKLTMLLCQNDEITISFTDLRLQGHINIYAASSGQMLHSLSFPFAAHTFVRRGHCILLNSYNKVYGLSLKGLKDGFVSTAAKFIQGLDAPIAFIHDCGGFMLSVRTNRTVSIYYDVWKGIEQMLSRGIRLKLHPQRTMLLSSPVEYYAEALMTVQPLGPLIMLIRSNGSIEITYWEY